MPVTFRLTIQDHNGNPIRNNYSATATAWQDQGELLPCTLVHDGTDDPLEFTTPSSAADGRGDGKLTIVGPAIPGNGKNNYANALPFSREAGGNMVLTVHDCPDLDITPDPVRRPLCQPPAAVFASEGAPPDTAAFASPLKGNPEFDCREVAVVVVDSAGKPVAGYSAELKLSGMPPLIGVKPVPANQAGARFRVRNTLADCRLTLYDPTGAVALTPRVWLDHHKAQTLIFFTPLAGPPVPKLLKTT